MITPDWMLDYNPGVLPDNLGASLKYRQFVYRDPQGRWKFRDEEGSIRTFQGVLESNGWGSRNYMDELLFQGQESLEAFLIDEGDLLADSFRRAIRKIRAYPGQREVLTFEELGSILGSPTWWPQHLPARSPVKNFYNLMRMDLDLSQRNTLESSHGFMGNLSDLGDANPVRSWWSDLRLARSMKLRHLADASTFRKHAVHLTLGTMRSRRLALTAEAREVSGDAEEIMILPDPQFQTFPQAILLGLGSVVSGVDYFAHTNTLQLAATTITGYLMPIPIELSNVQYPSENFLDAYAASQSISKPMPARTPPLDVLVAVEGI